jgi:hypothetical protein
MVSPVFVDTLRWNTLQWQPNRRVRQVWKFLLENVPGITVWQLSSQLKQRQVYTKIVFISDDPIGAFLEGIALMDGAHALKRSPVVLSFSSKIMIVCLVTDQDQLSDVLVEVTNDLFVEEVHNS